MKYYLKSNVSVSMEKDSSSCVEQLKCEIKFRFQGTYT